RDRYRHWRPRRRFGRQEVEGLGARQSGIVRHPLAANRCVCRPSLLDHQARICRQDAHRHSPAGIARTHRGAGPHAERRQGHRRILKECRTDVEGERVGDDMSINPAVIPGPERPRPWIVRHWLLALLSAVALLIVLGAAGCFAFLSMLEGGMKNSGAYQQAMEKVRQSPEVADALGTPIKEGFFVQGIINTNGIYDNADMTIPLSGPKCKGTANVVARKFAGAWELRRLEVKVDGQPEPIRLLQAAEQ